MFYISYFIFRVFLSILLNCVKVCDCHTLNKRLLTYLPCSLNYFVLICSNYFHVIVCTGDATYWLAGQPACCEGNRKHEYGNTQHEIGSTNKKRIICQYRVFLWETIEFSGYTRRAQDLRCCVSHSGTRNGSKEGGVGATPLVRGPASQWLPKWNEFLWV